MRVATCTPVDFKADEHFFGRDSGLLCRSFQQIGADCISIMPGTATADDAKDLIRCEQENLSDATWWTNLRLDLVVLYAWGDPRYRSIAMAIREAGIRLIQSLDTAGLGSPYSDWNEWLASVTGMIAVPQPLSSRLRHIAKAARDFFPAVYEKSRLEMIDTSDFVTAVSPPALESVSRYARALGFPQVADKVALVPHPIAPLMRYDGTAKEDRVLIVGRWEASDTGQKNPGALVDSLKEFLVKNGNWKAQVVGRNSSQLLDLCKGWSPELSARLELTPASSRPELLAIYCRSKILFCPSRFESFHISSGEALCCGCSVVVGAHPLLASTSWFTTENSGTLAVDRGAAALASALDEEARKWTNGARSPATISSLWIPRLHGPEAARTLLNSGA